MPHRMVLKVLKVNDQPNGGFSKNKSHCACPKIKKYAAQVFFFLAFISSYKYGAAYIS